MSELMSDLDDHSNKPLTGELGRGLGVPSSMYGLLALRQHRLNRAVGILRITPQVELLLASYEQAKQRERAEDAEALSKIANKSFRLGVIQGGRERMSQIMKEAKSKNVTRDRLIELLAEAQELQNRIDQITNSD